MTDHLIRTIDRFQNLRILVLGDFILDQFVFGEISRISREAPVLILRYECTQNVPGGGANTASNVESLGARAIPLGYIGDDEFADLLFAAWPETLEKQYVLREAEFQTTRKARILAGSFHSFRQQVVRMDYEQRYALEEHHERKLLEYLSALLPAADAVILSDYSLGNLNPRIRDLVLMQAAEHGKIIVADSRDHPDEYQRATSITPNISELEAALSIHIGNDLSLLEEVGYRMLTEWQLQALLVTRGKLGMSLFTKEKATHIPVFGTDEVADVTGAGDTVIAAYTTALAAGAGFEEAARLANYAAGIVVTKKGTATVSQAELRLAIETTKQ